VSSPHRCPGGRGAIRVNHHRRATISTSDGFAEDAGALGVADGLFIDLQPRGETSQ
jgi:hypothetical protein